MWELLTAPRDIVNNEAGALMHHRIEPLIEVQLLAPAAWAD